MLTKLYFYTAVLLFAPTVIFAAEFPIIKAVDGDSIEIGERRIRLDGIDAPEFNQICYDYANKEYLCGKSALRFLENLLKNKDIQCSCLAQKDKYKREICECFADGISINQVMVSSGWATAYRSDKYIDDEIYAQKSRIGIWQGKHMRPALFRILSNYKKQTHQKTDFNHAKISVAETLCKTSSK